MRGPWTTYTNIPSGHAVCEYGEIFIFWLEDENWFCRYSHDAGSPWRQITLPIL